MFFLSPPQQEISTLPSSLYQPPSSLRGTVVAETITEFIRFEPEICICNGNIKSGIQERICICNERFSAEIPTDLSL